MHQIELSSNHRSYIDLTKISTLYIGLHPEAWDSRCGAAIARVPPVCKYCRGFFCASFQNRALGTTTFKHDSSQLQ